MSAIFNLVTGSSRWSSERKMKEEVESKSKETRAAQNVKQEVRKLKCEEEVGEEEVDEEAREGLKVTRLSSIFWTRPDISPVLFVFCDCFVVMSSSLTNNHFKTPNFDIQHFRVKLNIFQKSQIASRGRRRPAGTCSRYRKLHSTLIYVNVLMIVDNLNFLFSV